VDEQHRQVRELAGRVAKLRHEITCTGAPVAKSDDKPTKGRKTRQSR
jgi:hypothetical protein